MTDAGDYKSDEELAYKRQILINCIENKVTISDELLARVLNMSVKDLTELRRQLRSTLVGDSAPLSWDYVMCFDAGSQEKMRMPTKKETRTQPDDLKGYDEEWTNGMTQRKYYLQIVQQTKEDLEKARLRVKQYKSADNDTVFLLIGITEEDLKAWADERNADLLVDPRNACQEGRNNGFPLALRTHLNDDDDPEMCTLPLDNWASMYVMYSVRAQEAIYMKYPRHPDAEDSNETPFSEKTRLRIIYEAIVADKAEGGAEIELIDHITSKKHPMIATFPLHRQTQLDIFQRDWLDNHNPRDWFWVPLEDIRQYFGEPVAFYFAFMQFYLQWLLGPTFLGFIFFIVQMATGQIDCGGIWLLGLFIIFWCVAFVDFWFRHEARLRLQWGMTKFEQKAVARPQFKGEWIHDDVTGLWAEDYKFIFRLLKSSATLGFILAFMTGCIVAVLYVLLFRDEDPTHLGKKIGIGVLNGVMIAVFDFMYKVLARYGNEWENHRTEQDYQNAMIFKAFIFKFFNSFSSLFYLAFVRILLTGEGFYIKNYGNVCKNCNENQLVEDGDRERTDGSICVSWDGNNPMRKSDLSNSDYECCADDAYRDAYGKDQGCSQTKLDNDINDIVLEDLRIQLASLFVTAIFLQNTLEVLVPWLIEKIKIKMEEREAQQRGEEVAPRSEAEQQMIRVPYESTIDDMSEIIIQFGYVTLFVMALPITPLMALINNIIELKVDGTNLVKQSQRPHPNGSYGLGAWNGVLSFFSIIAVATNVAIFTWRTSLVNDTFNDNSATKWIFFSITSVCLALLVAAEKAAIPDEPLEVLQGEERQRLIENVLVNGAQMEKDDDEKPKPEEDDEEYPFTPEKPWTPIDKMEDIPLENLAFLGEAGPQ